MDKNTNEENQFNNAEETQGLEGKESTSPRDQETPKTSENPETLSVSEDVESQEESGAVEQTQGPQVIQSNNEFLAAAKDKVIELHVAAIGAMKTTVYYAIELGEKLTAMKERVEPRKWGAWVDANLPFTSRTAYNYMRLFENKESVLAKYETVSELGVTETYRALARFPKDKEPEKKVMPAHVPNPPTISQDETEHSHSETGETADNEELFLGSFEPELAEKVLEFIRELGIDQQNFQILRGQGQIAKVKPTLLGKLAPYLPNTGEFRRIP